MTLLEKQQRLVEELAPFEDPHERLAAVLDRAGKSPPVPAGQRTDANRVRGCVSVVWLVGELRAGRCHFLADADSPVVRGLILLLCQFFSGATPAEIVATEADPLEALGVTRNLSPTRRNGLASVRAAIIGFATRNIAAPGANSPE